MIAQVARHPNGALSLFAHDVALPEGYTPLGFGVVEPGLYDKIVEDATRSTACTIASHREAEALIRRACEILGYGEEK